MSAPRTCPGCGFEPPSAARFCERCGHALALPSGEAPGSSLAPGPPGSSGAPGSSLALGPPGSSGAPGSSLALGPPGSSPASPSSPSPPPTLPSRFHALASHPDLPALLATSPEIPELAGKTLPSLLLLLALTVLGGFAALLAFQLCPPLGFVPLVLVILGASVVVRQLLRSARAALVARPALLVELRTRLQPGAERSHDHRRHIAVLELPTGERIERECFPSALAGLTPGTLGVAYETGERLAAFARLPV